MLETGQPAPDFSLPSQTSDVITLQQFRGKKLVLFFFPKSGSPGCTAEACSFRDNYEVFKEAGAEVVGISPDSTESQQSFTNNHRLPFLLLSDDKGEVRKRYKVPSTLGVIPGRVTYVIDEQGIIRYGFNSQFNSSAHINEALRILKR